MFNKTVFRSVGIALMFLLSACATTLPQPNIVTSVNGPLVNATDKSSLNRNRATSQLVGLHNASILPNAVPISKSNHSGFVSVTGPDWTKLFKSWENACSDSQEIKAFEKQFTIYDEKLFHHKLGKVNLPALYKSATGTPSTKININNTGNYSEFILPVTAGTYYGIPVKSIQLYVGHENGIGGKQVVLNASEKDVKQTLEKQKVSFKKRNDYQVSVSGDTKETFITCDHSN